MPDPRDQQWARALANLVADQTGMTPQEREQLFRNLVHGNRGAAHSPQTATGQHDAIGSRMIGSDSRFLHNRGLGTDATAQLRSQDVEFRRVESPQVVRQYLPESGVRGPLTVDAPQAVTVAHITLYDVDNVLPGLESSIASRLETYLNTTKDLADTLARLRIVFRVTHQDGMPPLPGMASQLPLDYAFYVLNEKKEPSFTTNVERLYRIMDAHHYPKVIPSTVGVARDEIRKDWAGGLRGVSLPPGRDPKRLAHKVCFLKGRQMLNEGANDWQYYVNLLLHEFGHLNNIYIKTVTFNPHPPKGGGRLDVMSTQNSTRDMKSGILSYNAQHLQVVRSTLVLLWAAQRSM